MKQENKKRLIDMCFAHMHNKTVADYFGGDENGRIIAEYLHRLKFDLPLEGLIDKKLAGTARPAVVKPKQTESNQVQPNPTQSNLIQPNPT
jgi:hypothetical protein